jgi:putative membrane protein
MSPADLPIINAILNGLSAIFLAAGYYFIRHKDQRSHRNCMISAFITSILFLICYLTYHVWYLGYHLHRGPTAFKDPPWFRPVYLTILLTHTVLAVVIVPLVLISLNRALKQRFELHRRIARWTWPLWMYVSVTGVIIYLFLYQIFPQTSELSRSPSAIQRSAR